MKHSLSALNIALFLSLAGASTVASAAGHIAIDETGTTINPNTLDTDPNSVAIEAGIISQYGTVFIHGDATNRQNQPYYYATNTVTGATYEHWDVGSETYTESGLSSDRLTLVTKDSEDREILTETAVFSNGVNVQGYDESGNPNRTSITNGNVSIEGYDAGNNLNGTSLTNSNVSLTAYDENGGTTNNTVITNDNISVARYNENGGLAKNTVITNDNISVARYNENGNIANNTSIFENGTFSTNHTYDNNGVIVQSSNNISTAEDIALSVTNSNGTNYGARLNAKRLVFGNFTDEGEIDPGVELSKSGLTLYNAPTNDNHAVRKSDLDSQVNALQSRINQLGSFSVDTSGIGANARRIVTLENSNAGQNTAINSNKTAISANTVAVSSLDTRVKALEATKNNTAALNKNFKKGMAKQAALNGLFQPYGVGKLSATAALGGSGKETAVAVGAGYRFNENLATKGGVAFSSDSFSSENQDYSYNIGVNYEW